VAKHSKVDRAVGLDISDKWTVVCVITMATGEEVEQGRVRTRPEDLRQRFAGIEPMRIALEVGAHSPWMSRLLEELGHEVLVANASKVALIHGNSRKRDRADAEHLARLARLDPRLLHPLRHRSEQAQHDLSVLRSRDQLVQLRTGLINHVRGVLKALGHPPPSCTTDVFARRMAGQIPEGLEPALGPVIELIAQTTETILGYERQIDRLAERYEVTRVLRQVRGVGPVTSLAYVLVLEDPTRFRTSRAVGAYLGLVPGLDESGDSSPRQPITRQGDALLRRLLVQCAHHILGPFGRDCDLRRFGQRIEARGGPRAKKTAAVAVARKLAVTLHRLWITGEVYDPFYTARQNGEAPEEEHVA
jgi:transposase